MSPGGRSPWERGLSRSVTNKHYRAGVWSVINYLSWGRIKKKKIIFGFRPKKKEYYSDYEQGKFGCTKVALTA